MMSSPDERVHLVTAEDLNGVAQLGADLFVELARKAAAAGHEFAVALSGGSTPRLMHRLLAGDPYRAGVEWSRVQFYWGDDRHVAPDDPDSNFRMARETLLDVVPLREEQIHRMRTEEADAHAAADLYEQELRHYFHLAPGQLPRFDLIYLGMGPDGHTASLFPHTPALHVADRLVVANPVAKLNTDRITLTAPVINNAAAVAFLVAGPDKAPALAAVLDGPHDPDEYPSQRIHPSDGELYWYVDRAAASQLRAR